MTRPLPSEPPPGLVAYRLATGQVLFVHPLPRIPEVEGLTSAEQEVLTLYLDGLEHAAIAEARGTSKRTTANQVASIFKKLAVGSRAELAAKMLRA